jgi:phage gp36-like protein
MSYCTLNDILSKRLSEETLIQLTDDAGAGVVDQDKAGQAIADAAELIDGYLRKRYTLPLTSALGLVKKLALDVAVYNLYGLRAEIDTPERIANDYSAALKVLENIQRGNVKLGVEEPSGQEATEALQIKAPARIFDDDTLESY